MVSDDILGFLHVIEYIRSISPKHQFTITVDDILVDITNSNGQELMTFDLLQQLQSSHLLNRQVKDVQEMLEQLNAKKSL